MSQNCNLLIDYFNGHLTYKEKEQFENHLSQCPECQEELKELEDLLGDVALIAKPVSPSAEMKERILGNVFAEEKVEISPIKADSPKNTYPVSKPWLTGLLAAGLTLSLLGNGYLLMQEGREQATDDQELTQPDNVIALEPTDAGGRGFAALFKQDKELSVMIQTQELPELTGSEVYQVWLLKDGSPIPAGDFTVDEQGKGYVFYKINASNNQDWDTIAITLEPDKGNLLPEGDILLSAGL